MTAHREHVYQRVVSDVGMSHVAVAAFTVLLALAITSAWVPRSTIVGAITTIMVLAVYLASPSVLGGRSQHLERD